MLHDHSVKSVEIGNFIKNSVAEKQNENIHIVDYQLLKKPDSNQPKSKIFIKDVTLLRKPDLLHNDIAIPNIFDSLDLTTTDDDIFDDFLGSDDQIFDDDFDFDESANLNNIESFPTPETTVEVELVEPVNADLLSGKIFVRKNLCNEGETIEVAEEPIEIASVDPEVTTSKIFVRSHESLTSQVMTTDVTQQPSEASTPDCIIVSSEIISPAPSNKIFIRNLETLTNAVQDQQPNQYYDQDSQLETVSAESYLNLTNHFPPSIYVRSYDSLVNDSHPDTSSPVRLEPTQSPQPRCKISIKNMNTLIEPILMQPPLMNPSMIFGQAQNLVIHMRPQQADESLLSYRDTSVTPDTLPTSSNVSTCGANDDVIVLDDSELNDPIFSAFDGNSQSDVVHQLIDTPIVPIEVSEVIDSPERIETPNEKTVLQKLEIVGENIQEECLTKETEPQPMVRIPIDFTESLQEPERKKVKIIKIIRIKRKRENLSNVEANSTQQLNNIQVIFRCSYQNCNNNFTSEQLLNYHKKCHSSAGLVCPECNAEEFRNLNTLHTHLWRSHKIDIDLFACKLCDFKTPILSRLKNFHAKIHSDEKNFKCLFQKCGKTFKNSKQLRNHSQIHKKKVVLKVKPVSSEDNENSKRIKCGECQKGFSSESGLYIHSMEHKTNEKKFNCEECDYSTNDHNSFRRHKSQHSLVHHYKCPACDYSSIQSNTYRKHLEKQHPDLAESLLHKCSSCKFTTISKSKFEGHLIKHYENDRQGKPGKKTNKIKVKSISLLTDPMHCNVLMKELLPNPTNDDDL